MQFMRHLILSLPTACLFLAAAIHPAFAQQPEPDDVVRFNTELVQTAITVVDKKGKFVDGLSRGDFEVMIDGKPRSISFLERITAASEREAQLAQRKQLEAAAPSRPTAGNSTVRGRTIVFFIYSIDARGLISGTLDATNNLLPDANGRMAAVASTEILATQDALNALAEDTGGRALRNQNYFDAWVGNVARCNGL